MASGLVRTSAQPCRVTPVLGPRVGFLRLLLSRGLHSLSVSPPKSWKLVKKKSMLCRAQRVYGNSLYLAVNFPVNCSEKNKVFQRKSMLSQLRTNCPFFFYLIFLTF